MTESVILPKHWTLRQRLKNHCIYFAIRLLWTLLGSLPSSLQRWFCSNLAIVAYYFAPRERRLAHQNLKLAFPNLTEEEMKRVIRDMFHHFGQSVAELLNLDESVAKCISHDANAEAFNALEESLKEKAGAIVVTGHIGNWELMAQAFSRAGFPISSVAKPIYDPRLTAWVDDLRGRYGMKTLWRGQSEGFKAILRVFRAQETFGILIDQDTKVPGDFVPFFGKPAYTPTAAATLHRRTGAPVLVGCHHRVDGKHCIRLTRIVADLDPNDPDFDREFTALLTKHLEEAIRREPAQWVWLHKRWKTQPVALTEHLGDT